MNDPELRPADGGETFTAKALQPATDPRADNDDPARPSLRDSLRYAFAHRSEVLRSASQEYKDRQRERAAAGMRWRDRPLWLAGRLALVVPVLAFAVSYVDMLFNRPRTVQFAAVVIAGGWLLLHHVLRKGRRPVLRRWARFTGRAWPLMLVLTGVMQTWSWPNTLLADLLAR